MDNGTIFTITGLAVFLVGSALMSATETAFTSVSRLKVKQLAEAGDKKALILDSMLKSPSSFLGTILLLNNLFNIAAASIATVLAEKYVAYPAAVATGVMTFTILVFAEISPKTFALKSADLLAFNMAFAINGLQRVLNPAVRLLLIISTGFLKIFGLQASKEGPFVTEEELKALVSVGQEEGVIEKEERELIHSIFEFGDTIVKEVMVPRMDMVAVDKKTSIDNVVKTVLKEGVSRIPVYDETIDNVVGMVYTRDLLILSAKSKNGKKEISTLLKQAYYVPETKRVIELLKELQKAKVHMAIVVDEYGGTSGLVTIEDLLEEIVGEIFDEYDAEEILIEEINKNNFRVDAKTNLDEINEKLKLNLPDAEYESIGGFVVNLFGKIPASGEKVSYNGLVFAVEKVARRRIHKLLITKKDS